MYDDDPQWLMTETQQNIVLALQVIGILIQLMMLAFLVHNVLRYVRKLK